MHSCAISYTHSRAVDFVNAGVFSSLENRFRPNSEKRQKTKILFSNLSLAKKPGQFEQCIKSTKIKAFRKERVGNSASSDRSFN